MRPVDRGSSPQAADFSDYRDAFPELSARLGPFCSYCERVIPTNLAVEHIQPKGLAQYAPLAGRWDNFLLACVNCNSTKLDKDVLLDETFLPDRDNTFAAFEYTPDGKVVPKTSLPAAGVPIATATLALTGLDKKLNEVRDANGQIVAIDRVAQRMVVWLIAWESHDDLCDCPTEEMRRQIARTAVASGFFSIWMKVFEGDARMRSLLIKAFPGTAADCFDAQTEPRTPRAPNGLTHCGKI